MKYFSILEPASTEAIWAFAKKRNIADSLAHGYRHPQEDSLIVSDNPPVFVVSDGVTLRSYKWGGADG